MRARILSDAPIPVNSAPGTPSDLPVPAGTRGRWTPLTQARASRLSCTRLRQTCAMRIEIATEPGDPRHPNEDYASVALPAVRTGRRAGGPGRRDTADASDVGCAHGVPWFTARLGGALLELSGSRTGYDAGRVPLGGHLSYRRGTPRQPVTFLTCALRRRRWSRRAGTRTTVEHLVLSDSVLLLEHPDGGGHARARLPAGRTPPARRDVASPCAGPARRHLPNGPPREPSSCGRSRRCATPEGGFFTAAADPAGGVPRGDRQHPRGRRCARCPRSPTARPGGEVFKRGRLGPTPRARTEGGRRGADGPRAGGGARRPGRGGASPREAHDDARPSSRSSRGDSPARPARRPAPHRPPGQLSPGVRQRR